VVIKAYYGIPAGVSELEKKKAHEEAKAASGRRAWADLKRRVFAAITLNAGQGVGDIKNAVVGSGQKITDAITVLEEEGLIRVEKDGRAKKLYPSNQNDAERYLRESNGE
jgi:hypothetical protein